MLSIVSAYSLFASISGRRRDHSYENTSRHTFMFTIISSLLFGLPHQSALGLACNAGDRGSWGTYVSQLTKKWRTSMTFVGHNLFTSPLSSTLTLSQKSMVLLSLNMCLLVLQDTQIPTSLPPSALISMALAIAAYILSQNLVFAYSGTVKDQLNVR